MCVGGGGRGAGRERFRIILDFYAQSTRTFISGRERGKQTKTMTDLSGERDRDGDRERDREGETQRHRETESDRQLAS